MCGIMEKDSRGGECHQDMTGSIQLGDKYKDDLCLTTKLVTKTMAMLRAIGITGVCFLCFFSGEWGCVAGLSKFKSCEGKSAQVIVHLLRVAVDVSELHDRV